MVKRGDFVRVVKGRKVPLGTEGYVFWLGQSAYGMRLGLKDDPTNRDEDPTWVAADNVEVIRPVQGDEDEGQDGEREEGEDTNATIESLRAQVKALQGTNDRQDAYWKGVLKASEEKGATLAVRLAEQKEALQAEVNTLRAEIFALQERKAAPPVLSERDAERMAQEAGVAVQGAILTALRARLKASQTPATPPKGPEHKNGAVRPLDLDPAPGGIARPNGIEAPSGAEPRPVPTPAPKPANVTQAVQVTKPAPKPAPTPAPASKLAKCPTCRAFIFGAHTCKK